MTVYCSSQQEEWDTVLFATGQCTQTLASSRYAAPTIGRKASTHSLELSRAGVRVDDDGKVVVNDTERTSAPNIYAIGDVAKVCRKCTCACI